MHGDESTESDETAEGTKGTENAGNPERAADVREVREVRDVPRDTASAELGMPRGRARGASLLLRGLGMKGPRGPVFRGLELDAAPGSLVAVEGPSGSGRTCLLLALTGRMRTSEGGARVGGHPLPGRLAAVRRISALGPVQGVSELDPALTVAEHLRERALLERRFGASLGLSGTDRLRPGRRRAAVRARAGECLAAAGLDLGTLPKGDRTAVRDLERVEALRLSLALALFGRPLLLAADDVDLKLSDAGRAEVWELLRGLARDGTTVLAVCSEAPPDALVLRTGEPYREDSEEPLASGGGFTHDGHDDEGQDSDALATTRRA